MTESLDEEAANAVAIAKQYKKSKKSASVADVAAPQSASVADVAATKTQAIKKRTKKRKAEAVVQQEAEAVVQQEVEADDLQGTREKDFARMVTFTIQSKSGGDPVAAFTPVSFSYLL